LPEDAARELADAYGFLRDVEHRLQYLDDAQRHRLPDNDEDRGRLARMMRSTDWPSFEKRLSGHRRAVTRHFEAILAEPGKSPEPWPDHPRLAALRTSQRYAALPDDSRR